VLLRWVMIHLAWKMPRLDRAALAKAH